MARALDSAVEAGASGEADDADQAGDEAVEGERRQRPGLEVAGQPLDGDVGRDAGDGRTEQEAVDVRAGGSGQRRQLEHAGGEDDRSRQKEGEPSGVAVGQAARQAPTMEIPERLIPARRAKVWKKLIRPASR